ncbi:MAG: circadian clock protein KaiA, partial [Pseudanabaena sp.]
KISPQVRHQLYVNIPDTPVSESLSVQQQRLADKLNERLGYLGVYYKRDSRLFFRNLSPEDRQEYIGRLKSIYRSIILEYFSEKSRDLNQKIDEFVNLSFFADISVSQVLEIHMELMDEFAKQLRLEGRNDEILLDYRITLIDMIAHLCELYRRSIPRS